MEIRNTLLTDLDVVMEIYDHARQYMRENGNRNQWINGYPGRDLITEDIQKKHSYVCMDQDRILGVFCFFRGIDPTYLHIYEGEWQNDKPYGVVHRIAAATHSKGVASFCLAWCFKQCKNIKIDTHKDNIIMQNMLKKNGYKECGIIYLESGDERVAFQKSEDF